MQRWLVAVAFAASACTNASSGPNPASTASLAAASQTPTPSASALALPSLPPGSASATRIPLPTTAFVAAAGNGVVWVDVDAHLFRSLDRGNTWEERAPPPSGAVGGTIAFVDDRNGWSLRAGSPTTGCMAEYYEVWRTTDGAATWVNTFKDDFPPSSGCKSNIAFVDAQRGYIAVASTDAHPAILRTSDAGRTWSRSPSLKDPPGFTFSPSATRLDVEAVADFGSVLFVSAVGQAASQYTRYVYRSSDAGATWSYAVTLPDPREIVFITPTRWLQLGLAASGSRETTDGGATWHSVPTDYGQAAGVEPQVVFGDATTGYASVRGGLQRTTDGGAHWTTLRTPGT